MEQSTARNVEKVELYIYLGNIGGGHFFMHKIHDEEKYTPEISCHTMNCMIHGSYIKSSDELCVVYDISPSRMVVNAIVITHVSRPQVVCDKKELETLATEFLKIKRDHPILVFAYDYDRKVYDFQTMDGKTFPTGDAPCHINEIVYFQTKKQI